MIQNERDCRHEHVLDVARQMLTAARTAPKGKGIESWQPQFTYYGFRYVQVEGAVPAGQPNPDGLPEITEITGLHTCYSAEDVGSFHCSKPLFNQTYELIDWAIRSNMASVLTDCPVLEESPVNLECRITQRIPLGSHDLFLAEVVACDVDESLLDEKGKLCLDKANLIVYSHGEYLSLGKKLGTFGYSVRKKKPGKRKK